MTTTYTNEELYLRYRAGAASDAAAATMVQEHRARFAEDPIDTGVGVWADTTLHERRVAVLQAIERAAHMPDGAEKQALIDHALGGARVREAAAVKGSR